MDDLDNIFDDNISDEKLLDMWERSELLHGIIDIEKKLDLCKIFHKYAKIIKKENNMLVGGTIFPIIRRICGEDPIKNQNLIDFNYDSIVKIINFKCELISEYYSSEVINENGRNHRIFDVLPLDLEAELIAQLCVFIIAYKPKTKINKSLEPFKLVIDRMVRTYNNLNVFIIKLQILFFIIFSDENIDINRLDFDDIITKYNIFKNDPFKEKTENYLSAMFDNIDGKMTLGILFLKNYLKKFGYLE